MLVGSFPICMLGAAPRLSARRAARLLDEDRIGERVSAATLDALLAAGQSPQLTSADFEALQRCGVFHADCSYSQGCIRTPDGDLVPADLSLPEARAELEAGALGTHLRNGALLHGGFFLGPKGFTPRCARCRRSSGGNS
jgi:hypothetical protein